MCINKLFSFRYNKGRREILLLYRLNNVGRDQVNNYDKVCICIILFFNSVENVITNVFSSVLDAKKDRDVFTSWLLYFMLNQDSTNPFTMVFKRFTENQRFYFWSEWCHVEEQVQTRWSYYEIIWVYCDSKGCPWKVFQKFTHLTHNFTQYRFII